MMAGLAPLRILETCLYATDLEAARAFYQDVLELQVISRVPGRHVFFRCGDGVLLVFHPGTTSIPRGSVPPHGADGPGHVAFGVSLDDLLIWKAHLLARGVPIEAEVEWPSGGQSVYFRDPAGNSLELATPMTWGSE